MYTTSLFSIVALAATVLASPAPLPSVTGTEGVLTQTPVGGALSPTKIAGLLEPALAAPPEFMTISIVNL